MAKSRSPRYQHLTKEELEIVRDAFSPSVQKYLYKGKRIDTWRVRYLMEMATNGAAMQLDSQHIEKAMLHWLKNPSKETLEEGTLDMVIKGFGYDPSAKDAGVSGKDLIDLDADLQALGSDSSAILNNPSTFADIKRLGAKAGLEHVRKGAIQKTFNLPDEALKDRDPSKLMNLIGELHATGFDVHIADPRLWNDLRQFEQGKLKNTDLLSRWSAEEVIDPKPKPKQKTPSKPKAKQKTPSKPKPKRRITLDPIVVRSRGSYRDTVLLSSDTEPSRPWLILRRYEDGSEEILTTDKDGALQRCVVEYEALHTGRYHPVMKYKPPSCERVPSEGSGRRVPGTAGMP